jgi:predicted helicase
MIFRHYKHIAIKLFQNNSITVQRITDKRHIIVNDPNDWAREHDYPRYILDLVLRIIELSVRTVEIVRGLPWLVI